MSDGHSHLPFGFEVAEVQHTVEGAIDTILWFQQDLDALESRLGALNRYLHDAQIPNDLVLEVFRVISRLRFHLEEAGEYQEILHRMTAHRARRARVAG
jgi:hypothetical protein